MKKYSLILISLLFLTGIYSCFDDEGNYDYHPVNELSITRFGDSVYQVQYMADTLRIEPLILGTLDSVMPEENYEFKWIVKNNSNLQASWGTTLARTRKLEYPVDLKPGVYSLYLKVKDKNTGLLFDTHSYINVSTTLSRGFLVLGDDEAGNVRLDMISMLPKQDTVVLINLLKDSGLPIMKGAKKVWHTGSYSNTANIRFWVMGEEESYYLDGANLTGSADNTIHQMFYSSLGVAADAHPIDGFPRVNNINGGRPAGTSYRGLLLSDGSIIYGNTNPSEFYGTPVNRLANDMNHLLPMFPYVFYSVGKLYGFMGYDTENEQFLYGTSAATSMALGKDLSGDPFPWNQKELKRTMVYGENTRNTYGGSTNGASYALMKDEDGDYYIYCFYAYVQTASRPPTKKGIWKIDKSVATNFDRAEHFLFSSSRTLLYYTVGGTLWCYDYNSGHERCEQMRLKTGTDEITFIAVDFQTTSSPYNTFWVGTYNSQTGGTLTKYREAPNQNLLEITPVDGSSWSNLCKIKSMEWRNSQY